MRLTVFTHVIHFRSEKGNFAYAPYVREMNLWFKNVEKVEIVAAEFPSNGIPIEGEPYHHLNLQLNAIPSLNFLNLKSIAYSTVKIPSVLLKMYGAMRRADHIHLRCPGNIGLLACFVQIFFPDKTKTAKYAGNWDPDAKQPWSYRLQKMILSNTFLTRKMTALVYGNWPDQSKNIFPFFTASFSENEREVVVKEYKSPFKFLFVGNLVLGKQPVMAIKIVRALIENNIPAELQVYGDGPLRAELEIEAKNKDYIHLHGNKPLEVLKQAYKDAHFLILASKSEGWPKAVAEAMFFGCIPIATAVSCVPWMLAAPPAPEGGAKNVIVTGRGILIPDLEKREVGRGKGNVVEKGLLDTFQTNRQFECFPDSPEGERGKVSRTGFSETLEVTLGKDKERHDMLDKVESGERNLSAGAGKDSKSGGKKLLNTFQKNRQFEWFPKTAKAVSENVSRTGFSETPAYWQGRLEVTSGTNNEQQDVVDSTVEIVIELLKDPEEMRRMSREAQEWSQEYTLERFEEAIKKVLFPKGIRP